jgi:gamma-glutamyltranspeptidase/glutathione hydrolase
MNQPLNFAALGALLLAACTQLPPPAAAPGEAARLSTAPPETLAPAAASFPMTGQRPGSGRPIAVRSAVIAPSGAAATAHPLATQTAIDILKAGGSAMDAAIAANAMLGLVEPTGNGIGGDLYAIVWDPQTERLYGYNGSGRTPKAATLEQAQAKAEAHGENARLPRFGTITVSVPGTVDGWFALHEKFGRIPMADNLAPTIRYAREGAPIPEMIAWYWSRGPLRYEPSHARGELEEYENARRTFFNPVPTEGSLFRNPGLANTLERIGRLGRGEFYSGMTARTMAAYLRRHGSAMTYEDFQTHRGEWMEPICVTYRGEVKLCELGPNTQGIAALQMLEMLERFDLKAMGFGSPDALTAMIEAKRLAFADRALGYADPAFAGIDPSIFVAPGYNSARSQLIDPSRAMPQVSPGTQVTDAALRDGDTTYLAVADRDGMMVSLIQSNYRGMGSGLVPDGLGFMFQNRAELFSLDPGHPNVFAGGKRPFHTIIPAFAFRKDLAGCEASDAAPEIACPYQPWLSFGLMGGGLQPQGHVQIITNLVDFGMGLQEAGDAARWEHDGGCDPQDVLETDCNTGTGKVMLERGLVAAAEALRARGYNVACCEANYGGYQAIMRDFRTGAWHAATEMRKDGSADGY